MKQHTLKTMQAVRTEMLNSLPQGMKNSLPTWHPYYRTLHSAMVSLMYAVELDFKDTMFDSLQWRELHYKSGVFAHPLNKNGEIGECEWLLATQSLKSLKSLKSNGEVSTVGGIGGRDGMWIAIYANENGFKAITYVTVTVYKLVSELVLLHHLKDVKGMRRVIDKLPVRVGDFLSKYTELIKVTLN